jgi:hypothetical protein
MIILFICFIFCLCHDAPIYILIPCMALCASSDLSPDWLHPELSERARFKFHGASSWVASSGAHAAAWQRCGWLPGCFWTSWASVHGVDDQRHIRTLTLFHPAQHWPPACSGWAQSHWGWKQKQRGVCYRGLEAYQQPTLYPSINPWMIYTINIQSPGLF